MPPEALPETMPSLEIGQVLTRGMRPFVVAYKSENLSVDLPGYHPNGQGDRIWKWASLVPPCRERVLLSSAAGFLAKRGSIPIGRTKFSRAIAWRAGVRTAQEPIHRPSQDRTAAAVRGRSDERRARRALARGFEAVEFATLEWVDWFNTRPLLEPIGNMPPAEAYARYFAQPEVQALAA